MKNKLDELYISLDVESDGPCPGINNLLSAGFAAFHRGKLIDTHEANLELLPDCKPNSRTMREFWQKDAHHQRLYDVTRVNTVSGVEFANHLVDWSESLRRATHSKVLFAAAPATYDYKWIDYYLHRFYGDNPFGFASCVDTKSVIFGRMNRRFQDVSKRNYPKHWFPKGLPHTHIAIDDAIEQGHILINMLNHYEKMDSRFTEERLTNVIKKWVDDNPGKTVTPSELVKRILAV